MAKLIKALGEITEISPRNSTVFSLEELYELLDCELVQTINVPGTKMLLIVDEEGKLKGKEINFLCTIFAHSHRAIFPHDRIVGDAILCNKKQLK